MLLDIVRRFLDEQADKRRGLLKILGEFERQFAVALRVAADTLHDCIRVNQKFRKKTYII